MTDLIKHQPLICLLVRLLGVFFVVEGVVGLIGNGIDCWAQWRYASEWDMPFAGGYALAWTIASSVSFAAGLILIFKSKIALDAIFHETIGDDAG